jgi:hypothetical protein
VRYAGALDDAARIGEQVAMVSGTAFGALVLPEVNNTSALSSGARSSGSAAAPGCTSASPITRSRMPMRQIGYCPRGRDMRRVGKQPAHARGRGSQSRARLASGACSSTHAAPPAAIVPSSATMHSMLRPREDAHDIAARDPRCDESARYRSYVLAQLGIG